MTRRFSQAAIAVGLMVLAPMPAQAQYLDPGAGSVMVQVIVAAVIGVATVVKLYWSRIKGLFRRRPDTPES